MLLKSRWRSHESGVKPGPLALDSPIQAISLLFIGCGLEEHLPAPCNDLLPDVHIQKAFTVQIPAGETKAFVLSEDCLLTGGWCGGQYGRYFCALALVFLIFFYYLLQRLFPYVMDVPSNRENWHDKERRDQRFPGKEHGI
jgi:hypothetical protein